MSEDKIGQKPAYSVYEERDTYRDLCAELLEHLKRAYYAPSVQIDEPLEASITKAEKILGDKNGTAN